MTRKAITAAAIILTKDQRLMTFLWLSFPQLPILVSSVVSLYFLEWTDVFKPVKSGFHCHDRSLSLPYVDPNHEVIPLLMLLSLAFAGPAITVSHANPALMDPRNLWCQQSLMVEKLQWR